MSQAFGRLVSHKKEGQIPAQEEYDAKLLLIRCLRSPILSE